VMTPPMGFAEHNDPGVRRSTSIDAMSKSPANEATRDVNAPATTTATVAVEGLSLSGER